MFRISAPTLLPALLANVDEQIIWPRFHLFFMISKLQSVLGTPISEYDIWLVNISSLFSLNSRATATPRGHVKIHRTPGSTMNLPDIF